jgi:hypothetical protein
LRVWVAEKELSRPFQVRDDLNEGKLACHQLFLYAPWDAAAAPGGSDDRADELIGHDSATDAGA